MRFWLVKSSESTPADGEGARLMRMSFLAKALLDRGHEVTWWNDDFNHTTKKHRFGEDKTVEVEPRFFIRFLHGPGYQKHISLKRYFDHRIIAKKFMALADRSPAPDLIHCCLPTLDLADAAAKLGKKYDIPTTLDIRDLWPDVFYDRLPKALRFLGPTLLSPYNSLARNACRYATALTGNSPKFVEWGLLKAAREATPYDVPFPFGYHEPKLTASEIDKADQFWERLGINDGNALPIACFFGKIGYQFQFDSLIQGIKTYLANNKALFVLCGNGPTLDDLRRGCRDEPHIIFPGLVDKSQIWRLMAKSKIALAPYNDSVNFRDNLANKLIEYMAGAVPVLYSLDEGYVADLIREHEIGLTYGSSSERLAQAIHRLLDDEAYRRRLSDNARNLYLKKYQGEKIYSEMAAHLENIVKNSGK